MTPIFNSAFYLSSTLWSFKMSHFGMYTKIAQFKKCHKLLLNKNINKSLRCVIDNTIFILITFKFYNESINFNFIHYRVKWSILNVKFDMLYVCKMKTTHTGITSSQGFTIYNNIVNICGISVTT